MIWYNIYLINEAFGREPSNPQSFGEAILVSSDPILILGIGAPAIGGGGGGALLPPVRRPWESGMSVESFTRGRSTAQPRTPRRPTRGSVEQPAMSYTIFFVFLNCEPFTRSSIVIVSPDLCWWCYEVILSLSPQT